MSLLDVYAMPGMGTEQVTSESEFLWGTISTWQLVGRPIVSGATDSGNTPTTTLRRGLVMGIRTDGQIAPYAPGNTDGSQIPVGFLRNPVNMLDQYGNARQASGLLVIYGFVKAGQVFGLDENVRRFLNNRFVFDDRYQGSPGSFPGVVAKTANYTVLTSDVNTTFTTQGAGGPVMFTLPAPYVGGRFRFFNEAGQNLLVTCVSVNKLVAFNNLTATTVALQTAGQLIGGGFEVIANADGSKWLVLPIVPPAMTVTVS